MSTEIAQIFVNYTVVGFAFAFGFWSMCMGLYTLFKAAKTATS